MANSLATNLKKHQGIVQFIKFGIVGVANTGVDWITFYILTATFLDDSETVAKAIAFLVAMINSYIFNTIWTFKKEYQKTVGKKKDNKAVGMVFVKFAAVSLVGWGVNTYVFNLVRFNMDQGKLIALVFASGAAILWNFFANKFWTYKK